MDQKTTITVETIIQSSVEKLWEYWTEPEHIVNWAFASDHWEAPHAENDVRVGGKFRTVMAAKDKSASFDFTGVYSTVKIPELLEYDMDDGRHVKVEFAKLPQGVRVIETFEPEETNPKEMQKSGWQAILDNFKRYVEGS
jgi:uncharacterized protein YndB with AHSA1/START domain